jgi:cell pole-organizing protein PopZ
MAGLGRELPMSQPAKASETKVTDTDAPEPSIDEILASIRRSIVPDDDVERPPAAAPARKPGSRKPSPAAGAKGRRANGEAARAGSDATPGEGADKGAEREPDSSARAAPPAAQAPFVQAPLVQSPFVQVPVTRVGLGEEASAAETAPAPGWEDEDNAPGHRADAAPLLPGPGDGRAFAKADSVPGGHVPDGPTPDAPLLSPHTTAAVDTAFYSLTHTVLSQNPRTVEDLVREMLKPMLKAWLDAHLPDMVERLVRAEIERVSRRGPRG